MFERQRNHGGEKQNKRNSNLNHETKNLSDQFPSQGALHPNRSQNAILTFSTILLPKQQIGHHLASLLIPILVFVFSLKYIPGRKL